MGITVDVLREKVQEILDFLKKNQICNGMSIRLRRQIYYGYWNRIYGMQILFDSAFYDNDKVLSEVDAIISYGKKSLSEICQIED